MLHYKQKRLNWTDHCEIITAKAARTLNHRLRLYYICLNYLSLYGKTSQILCENTNLLDDGLALELALVLLELACETGDQFTVRVTGELVMDVEV